MFRLCKAQDLLISEQANERKSKRRSKLKRAVRRLRDRIRNLIDEVHKQLAVHLARSYDLVMIPKFEVSQMIRKVGRKIGAKTARQMATWAHDRFRQRLTFKCCQFGCKVAIVNEALHAARPAVAAETSNTILEEQRCTSVEPVEP